VSTWETVPMETPAKSATSLMVDIRRFRFSWKPILAWAIYVYKNWS
jgi:hypothetical protein